MTETLPTVVPPIQFGWMFVKMIGVLAILVILLLFVGRYLLPRLGKGRWAIGQKGRLISVVDRFALEPRKNIYLLKVAKKYLLVGTGDHSIHALTELEKEDVE